MRVCSVGFVGWCGWTPARSLGARSVLFAEPRVLGGPRWQPLGNRLGQGDLGPNGQCRGRERPKDLIAAAGLGLPAAVQPLVTVPCLASPFCSFPCFHAAPFAPVGRSVLRRPARLAGGSGLVALLVGPGLAAWQWGWWWLAGSGREGGVRLRRGLGVRCRRQLQRSSRSLLLSGPAVVPGLGEGARVAGSGGEPVAGAGERGAAPGLGEGARVAGSGGEPVAGAGERGAAPSLSEAL
eukprot:s2052_g5.t1